MFFAVFGADLMFDQGAKAAGDAVNLPAIVDFFFCKLIGFFGLARGQIIHHQGLATMDNIQAARLRIRRQDIGNGDRIAGNMQFFSGHVSYCSSLV